MDSPESSCQFPAARSLLGSVPIFSGLDQSALRRLEQEMVQVRLATGDILMRRGDPGDSLFVIISGCLQVLLQHADGAEQVLAQLAEGDCLGEIALLTGQPRSATIKAVQESELLKLTKEAFDRFAADYPDVQSRLVQLASHRQSSLYLALTDLFRGLDRSVLEEFVRESTWLRLPGGETLFHQGDQPDCFYAVVHGRLQVLIQSGGADAQIVRHIGRGTCVGETSLLTGEPHSATVRALRDSELVRLPKATFTRLLEEHPRAATELAKTLARRLRQSSATKGAPSPVATIAVVPGDKGVTQARFAERLVEALAKAGGATLHLSSDRLDGCLGDGASQTSFDGLGNSRIVDWLNDQEDKYHYILFECDLKPSVWTYRCLRQADLILIVHTARGLPAISEIEAWMQSGEVGSGARRELVMLHPDDAVKPVGTGRWLQACRVETHHHVRAERRSDYERLARLITGRSINLVLSGGGARGFAHIGVIRAILESGLPIDLVGGTSMGSIIAGQYAMGLDPAQMIELNRKGFVGIAPQRDKTVPIVAMITGRKLVRMLSMMFGETQIEDLWIKFFCVSANLTRAKMMVHQDGPLWLWTRASVAVPGAIPPVIHNGDLLVDGGVLNNLPVDVVSTLSQGIVIAVDVAARVDLTTSIHSNPILSGWPLLWSWLNPFAERVSVPNIFNILTRATMLNTLSKTETIKSQADIYIHPSTEKIGIFDWKSIDKTVEIGYRCAVECIEEWQRNRAR